MIHIVDNDTWLEAIVVSILINYIHIIKPIYCWNNWFTKLKQFGTWCYVF